MKKRKYLLSIKSLEKKSKASLLRLIMKHLKTKSKKSLARLAYSMIKSKLPRLKKGFIELDVERYTKTGGKEIKWYPKGKLPKRKTKRKFSPKQLAAQRLFAKRARAGTLRKRRV
tara:strand:- start:75 stop:419 length:345 start_codon:yes stop_codon:yes gene_type:complete